MKDNLHVARTHRRWTYFALRYFFGTPWPYSYQGGIKHFTLWEPLVSYKNVAHSRKKYLNNGNFVILHVVYKCNHICNQTTSSSLKAGVSLLLSWIKLCFQLFTTSKMELKWLRYREEFVEWESSLNGNFFWELSLQTMGKKEKFSFRHKSYSLAPLSLDNKSHKK